jgi:hypothetical protein
MTQTLDHAQVALVYLRQADDEFAIKDNLQGSGKLWGAASQAVLAVAAVAAVKGWPSGSHYALKAAADKLAEDRDDPALESGFFAAQQFHANFYHGFMEEDDIARGRPLVRDFVHRVLHPA